MKPKSGLGSARRQFARDLGRRGGVVDEHGPFGHGSERAVQADRHLTQVIVIADAAEHEILVRSRLGWRRRRFAAVLGYPFVGLGAGAIVDGEIVALCF